MLFFSNKKHIKNQNVKTLSLFWKIQLLKVRADGILPHETIKKYSKC